MAVKNSGIFAAALVAAALLSCRPEGQSQPVFPDVPRGAFAETWTDRKVVLVGIGDSITAGFGASPGRSYFDLLVGNSPGDAPEMRGVSLSAVLPNLEARNVSMSYTTSAEHLEYQVERLPVFGAEVLGIAVITTGGNDLIHDYGRSPPRDGAMYGATAAQARGWLEAFEKRLEAILGGVRKRFPGGCNIFLANIYDPTDGVGDIENAGAGLGRWRDGLEILKTANEIIARCAGRHDSVHLVDIRAAFLGHGIHCRDRRNPHYRSADRSYWYYENLEDPNDLGYDAIRRLFLGEMAAVLGGAPRQSDRETGAPE